MTPSVHVPIDQRDAVRRRQARLVGHPRRRDEYALRGPPARHEGIDGGKRLRARDALGVAPKVVNLGPNPDAESVVPALNVLRTRDSPSQHGMFAAERANATKGDGGNHITKILMWTS